MLLQYLRGRAARDFSRDRVLFFEVCGGTVCSTKSHNPSSITLSLLPCLLIMFSWTDSRFLSRIFWPRREKLQGNRSEAETYVYFQVGCRHGFMWLTSKILWLIPWHDKNVLLWFIDWRVTRGCRTGWYTKIVSQYFVVMLIDIENNHNIHWILIILKKAHPSFLGFSKGDHCSSFSPHDSLLRCFHKSYDIGDQLSDVDHSYDHEVCHIIPSTIREI